MEIYLVSYDLHQPGRDYSDLIAANKSYPSWAHAHESVWFVQTDQSASQVARHLFGYADSNDSLMVVKAAAEAAWYNLNPQVSEWLKERLRDPVNRRQSAWPPWAFPGSAGSLRSPWKGSGRGIPRG